MLYAMNGGCFYLTFGFNLELLISRGHAVAQVDEALPYKPKGCWFDSNGIVH